ncbi:MAG: RtcB family protein [DPANN group archaeon]|nr:RtcB family protein [DPANN group archaeon]
MIQLPKERPPVKQISEVVWEISPDYKKDEPKMLVPARIYATKKLMEQMDMGIFEQISNVACLPGIQKAAMAMPDAHWGYGFPVGGVAAFDTKTGIISPGGIGYDINCGMRLIRTDLTWDDIKDKLKPLVDTLFKLVPAGVGGHGTVKLTPQQHKEVMVDGAKWCVKNNYGWQEDIERIEDSGAIEGADPAKVSESAVKRGAAGLGTLGSGNHYLEIQVVKKENIYDEKLAKSLGIFPNQVCIMVHCGSRGFGHQICTDYVSNFKPKMQGWGLKTRDFELACAPFQSNEAQDYLAAMRCAANYAFANRQLIMHRIREGFSKIFNQDAEKLGMNLIYDVAHNIAKVEKHTIDGKTKEVVMHRKGATRAFGPNRKETPKIYRDTGQPVIVGGSMETGSFLCVGTDHAELETFGSTMHGSGRTMSRTAAIKQFQGKKLYDDMLKRGIYVKSVSWEGLAEEAGLAYKDINQVVDTMEIADVSKKVCRLVPVGNVKG